jgi:mitochondrial import inner membrane translocase subunit TIM22
MTTEWWPRKVLAPVFPAGMEPLPPGLTEEDRSAIAQQKKIERFMTMGSESCLFKTAVTAGGGTVHVSPSISSC